MSLKTYYPTATLKIRTMDSYIQMLASFINRDTTLSETYTVDINGSGVDCEVYITPTSTQYDSLSIRLKWNATTNSKLDISTLYGGANVVGTYSYDTKDYNQDVPVYICPTYSGTLVAVGSILSSMLIFKAQSLDGGDFVERAMQFGNDTINWYDNGFNIVKSITSNWRGDNIGASQYAKLYPLCIGGCIGGNIYYLDGCIATPEQGLYTINGNTYLSIYYNIMIQI